MAEGSGLSLSWLKMTLQLAAYDVASRKSLSRESDALNPFE